MQLVGWLYGVLRAISRWVQVRSRFLVRVAVRRGYRGRALARGGAVSQYRRGVRLGLILGLVPVVWLGTGTPVAEAAATYGESATAVFNSDGDSAGGSFADHTGATGIGCTVSGYWSADGALTRIEGAASCSTGWGVASALLTLTATGPGQTCTLTVPEREVDGADRRSFEFLMSGSSCGPVTQLCWHANMSVNILGGDNVHEGCVPWALGAPPSVGGEDCGGGTVTANFTVGDVYLYDDGTLNGLYWAVDVQGSVIGSTREWTTYVLTRGSEKGSAVGTLAGSLRFDRQGFQPTSAGQFPVSKRYLLSNNFGEGSLSLHPKPELVGFGYARDNNALNFNFSLYSQASNPGGSAGLTDSANCWAYFGPKVVEDSASARDEPAGPLLTGGGSEGTPDPPVIDPEPPASGDGTCQGFSLTDPLSWAGAGICVLVKYAGRMVDLLLHLPGAIASAIGDLVEALLVPEDGFLDGRMNSIRQKLQNSSPGLYAASATDLVALPNGTGCGGVPVHFDLGTEPASPDVDFDLGAACSGDDLHGVAGICRVVLAAGLVLAGGLQCIRLVGGSLVPELKDVGRGRGASA
jgi:hypothetical protein